MISANIPKTTRKAVYKRDGYRCALCDSPKYIQIHHVIPRSEGGSDFPENLITLCSVCHGQAHGVRYPGYDDITEAGMHLACVEYVSDYYAGEWYPFK